MLILNNEDTMNTSDLPISTESNKIADDIHLAHALGEKGAKKAVIAGAGAAGLTVAYELLKRTDIVPIILEKTDVIGGNSKTINCKGNLIDVGGHRFCSKSDRVMKWLRDVLASQRDNEDNLTSIEVNDKDDESFMLVRNCFYRIFFLRNFFSYPNKVTFRTVIRFGVSKAINIYFSYLWAQLKPRKPQNNLEDFLVNHFGNEFYKFFFKNYAEKLWGLPCKDISAICGPEMVSVISGDQFLYPKFGPGQFWDEMAWKIKKMGGTILTCHNVDQIYSESSESIRAIQAVRCDTGETTIFEANYFFSTMPLKELISGLGRCVPDNVREVAQGLQHRDFITVGILLKRMSIQDIKTGEWKSLKLMDTWIYIQERDVKVGRLQIFNNWSQYMVSDPETVWVGMEFFCNEDDDLWNQTDSQIKEFAMQELERLGLATSANLLDSEIVKVRNRYPAYGGTYSRFDEVKDYTDQFENLFLIGQSGRHQNNNNNSDHSILSAIVSVDNICQGTVSKESVWSASTDSNGYEMSIDPKYVNKSNMSKSRQENALDNDTPQSLMDYVFNNPANKWFIRLAIPIIFLQFIIFKLLYPFAGFINGDSYVYLETAYHNFYINTYPIGYSKFLRLISVFTHSDTVVVAIQYFLLQATTLSLIFTLFYFYSPVKLTKILLFGVMLVNPVYLYLANYISSDAFFLSLSLTWFTLLIWIMNRPSIWMIIVNSFVLFMAFSVRYNALFYPVISVVALLLTRRKVLMNIFGFCISILLIVVFMWSTTNKYAEISGHRQFTPFTGWQMANNALYAYRYVDSAHRKDVPLKLRQLDKIVRNYFDSSRDIRTHPSEALIASTVYMWAPNSPLSIYMDGKFKKDSTATPLKRWSTVAPIMNEYGSFLMKTYPNEFIKFYLIPNAMKYYAPPVEFLNQYSTGVDSVNETAKVWFGYKSNKIKCYFKDFRVTVLDFYPILTGTMNVVLVFSLISFIILRGYKRFPELKKGLILLASLWAVNFGFSVFASPIALRFQLFPILISLSFTFLLLEFLIRSAMGTNEVFNEEVEKDKIMNVKQDSTL
jgi:protoporphyrinogen oxidase